LDLAVRAVQLLPHKFFDEHHDKNLQNANDPQLATLLQDQSTNIRAKIARLRGFAAVNVEDWFVQSCGHILSPIKEEATVCL